MLALPSTEAAQRFLNDATPVDEGLPLNSDVQALGTWPVDWVCQVALTSSSVPTGSVAAVAAVPMKCACAYNQTC